ncbi:DDE-type integrase/transposase/recombinase [Paenibacillus sp. OSY-SE]|uniref:DDE-type integrase/transposase/recombinase n=1 Tax=Paenibacillus sp. OSY-SE TaxID=1196323 RepID=UPI003FCE416B
MEASIPCCRAAAEASHRHYYISDGTRFITCLSAIQDLFNNEIVAWQLSERNDVKLLLDTIEQWILKREVSEAVLHSDQGFQYTSSLQLTIGNIRRQRQPLSQSNLPG